MDLLRAVVVDCSGTISQGCMQVISAEVENKWI